MRSSAPAISGICALALAFIGVAHADLYTRHPEVIDLTASTFKATTQSRLNVVH